MRISEVPAAGRQRGGHGKSRAAVNALMGTGLIGVVSGLRSQLGVAAVALTTDRHRAAARPGALLAGRRAGAVAATAAAGELVGDKLPNTPSRLGPAGLLPRIVLGAFAATALADRAGRGRRTAIPLPAAAAIGAAAAFGGAHAGARWRRAVADRGLPDWPAALAEDAVAAALAWAACALLPG
ncbi:hypothetical protein [Actinacidiphila sp. ITFR-21]|uniref:hypothetical protein n=1 Tax=Actinacidiphila sp. ITFR-21 TaxID=3075199 RepID=UPI00288C1FC0|nr:hypothetical protein [Streptomyces sp. ITFR-21]WNI14361.1 hypothetical protein RLT57_01625 [Streptomyces sp. ITFR-21]